jgi:hypothetical protein
MLSFILATLISMVLIVVSTMLFYEILAAVWLLLPKLKGRPRTQIVTTVMISFFGHALVVWMFGISFYLLDVVFHVGTLRGADVGNGFLQYIYFSGVNYSSLGLGDVYPTGEIQQLLIGVEGILGLMLIGWTVAITYLVTQKYLIHRSGTDHPFLK